MNGVILMAIGELVKEKLGADKWADLVKKYGIKEPIFMTQNFDDRMVVELLKDISKMAGVGMDKLFEMFAEYWMDVFAPKRFPNYFRRYTNAKDFLKAMDTVHSSATAIARGATPPRFECEEPDPKTLIMTYRSPRKLYDLWVALIKAVGKHFKEKLTVTRITNDKVKITFG